MVNNDPPMKGKKSYESQIFKFHCTLKVIFVKKIIVIEDK